jgi:hypothetical protein
MQAGGEASIPWPDLDPIEQVFAKLKTSLHKATERTVEATWKRIAALLKTHTSQECSNHFRNARYASIRIDQTLARRLTALPLRRATSAQIGLLTDNDTQR